MLSVKQFQQQVAAFAAQLRNQWQMFFLPAALLFAISLGHSLFSPRPPLAISDWLHNGSFLVAVVLAVIIFNTKRRYFSRRFVRQAVEGLLGENPERPADEILSQVLNTIRRKMTTVWLLGALIMVNGVVYYWISYNGFNLNIYGIVAVYSLVINYPRKELFMDIPWLVVEEKKFHQKGADGGPKMEPF